MPEHYDYALLTTALLLVLKIAHDLIRNRKTMQMHKLVAEQGDRIIEAIGHVEDKVTEIDKTVSSSKNYHQDFVLVQRQMAETLAKVTTMLEILVQTTNIERKR